MIGVIRTAWPLLLGVMLLMVGNGMQGTLLGVRGAVEGMSTQQMAVVMSGYFAGFLLGSLTVPRLIQGVGHVRVFAALGSLISAVLILYGALPQWIVWAMMRVVIGFSFCGVYITAESWLNASARNDNRGQAMSAYMIVQMAGLVAGQILMNFGDPAGFMLFVIPSVLVSLAFTPILLSSQPAPQFETLTPLSIGKLFRISPLGCVGILLTGMIFAGLTGMASVWGMAVGLSVRDVSAFVAAIYLGGLLLQYPIGYMSDRTDRRIIITALAVFGAVVVAAVLLIQPGIWGLILAALLIGGVANPIYSLLIAYTNDFLPPSEMAGASAGLLFVNGFGSVAGPFLTAWLMGVFGTQGFWVYIGLLLMLLAGYAGYRMTRRSAPGVEAQGNFAVLSPNATPLAVELVMAEADEANRAEEPVREDVVTPKDVTDFWLNDVGPKGWYEQSDALDQQVRDRFLETWGNADTVAPEWAAQGAEGALAALILTDQFPRNMFRNDPRAFATDDLARKIADQAIVRGEDMETPEPARQFFYLPFEHAEDIVDQNRAVTEFRDKMPGENLRHAELHRDTIARFGRFPWRNAALDREPTEDEQKVMDAGGYGALVSGRLSLADL
ncbi:MAG: hypothetical protein DI498_10275 [Paracoccus denitrificans]|nr:MAG: hypothetical protein DI498_10275 [Paracoccus denitrificans]PZO83825.1 MAG: hypothetical protein DI633_10275 [Paracoccus denitrificans]